MKYLNLFLLNLLWVCQNSTAQTVRGTGLVFDDAQYRQQKPLFMGIKADNMPLSKDLKAFCPKAGDQGPLETCSGWSVAHAMTIGRAVQLGIRQADSVNRMMYSALYVFNQISKDCKQGASLTQALDLVKEKGNCFERTFPSLAENCEKLPNEVAFTQALDYRISHYAPIFNTDDSPQTKAEKTMQAISEGRPVVVGLAISTSFQNAEGMAYWTPEEQTENGKIGHALVAIGYQLGDRSWIELMNSYGDTWGKNGFIKMKALDFGRVARYGYTLSFENVNILRGAFLLKKIEPTESKTVVVQWFKNQKYYETLPESWPLKTQFQLSLQHIAWGKYVYVLSFNNERRAVTINYPEPHQTAFVFSDETELLLPSPETAMTINKKGDDYLCVVYADKPIEDFDKRCSALEKSHKPFVDSFKTAFEDLLIPEKWIERELNSMQFAVKSNKRGAVAIIVKVKGQ